MYVGNVDYSVTPAELDALMSAAGLVNRVTILTDKFTGHPKGFAYVEYASTDSIEGAILLAGRELKGREISVTPKRTNVPYFAMRGRGGGGGGGGPALRGSYRGGSHGPVRGRGAPRGGRGGGPPGGGYSSYY